MRVDAPLCQHCGAKITRRADERPGVYVLRKFCDVLCLGQAKVARRQERFWERVEKRGPDECWPWTGYITAGGYGQFGTCERPYSAHRLALRFSDTEIPEGRVVMHSCDNPPCCNPAHLSVGTHADNNRDMITKGRQRHLTGEDHPHAKLTNEQRRAIVSRRGEPLPKLASEFGVAKSTICRVQRSALCA